MLDQRQSSRDLEAITRTLNNEKLPRAIVLHLDQNPIAHHTSGMTVPRSVLDAIDITAFPCLAFYPMLLLTQKKYVSREN